MRLTISEAASILSTTIAPSCCIWMPPWKVHHGPGIIAMFAHRPTAQLSLLPPSKAEWEIVQHTEQGPVQCVHIGMCHFCCIVGTYVYATNRPISIPSRPRP